MSNLASATWPLTRPLLFQLDPERAHRLTLALLARYARVCRTALSTSDDARAPSLVREKLGLTFPNPVGLAAGLDKDGEALEAWQALGFGFIEVGTVTAHAQPGNERPRLFRLKSDAALLNRMGFNNHGAAALGRRLAEARERGKLTIPVGVNIGKSKVTPNDEAAADYRTSFEAVGELADYLVVNISSPNTPGLRDLQTTSEVRRIVSTIMVVNARLASPRPVLVKLAPDLDDESTLACAEAALDEGARGLVLSNTTIRREGLSGPVPEGPGGVSGRPVFARSTEQLREVRARIGPDVCLIGVGGIEDEATARDKLDAGADLVQVYTGFIYGGPGFVRRLCRALVDPSAAPNDDERS